MLKNDNLKPRHVLIIPDGNRRWARSRDLKPWEGHWMGAEKIEEITRKALALKIKSLTFWGSSQDNLTKRPFLEKKALLEIYEKYFKRLIKSREIMENEVKIQLVGRWKEQFPSQLKNILEDGVNLTKNHSKYLLNFLLAYGGDDDIMEGVKRIVARAKEGLNEKELTKDFFANHLLSANLPPVDLIIRTGVEGDPHNSAGVLMWQTQDSQYYFSEKMFPDFGAEDFEKAINDFGKRERRKGK
ncbi:MAG TPA: di-trans,poly-cis-decaprenylcistransferase [Candidatus Moranbacteria bacterium]|nr:di-trans,poly-cis-decaprenylcistransferase [Candidatus Moranbacteria bacterium]